MSGDYQLLHDVFGIEVQPSAPDDPRAGQTPPRLSAPRSKKVGRGRSASTIVLGAAAREILAGSSYAMTLRQLYYALVSAGAIHKNEAAYGQLKRVMRDLREDGSIPWEWLVDHTRSVFAPRTWDGIEDLLTDTASLYRRDLMRQQKVAIQLWAESDSIGSVIAQVADRYTIPTFIGRGYAARGYLWSAAKDAFAAHEADKNVVILHVGDFDPSGVDIFRDVVETLRLYAIAVDWDKGSAEWGGRVSVADVRRSIRKDITDSRWYYAGPTDGEWGLHLESWTRWLAFDRLALTAEQIDEYDLPARPPKASDVRTATFTGKGTVEVEALPVEALLAIVEQAIVKLIDGEALRIVEQAEESERAIVRRIAATPVERLVGVAS
jgi:hypothetical protein